LSSHTNPINLPTAYKPNADGQQASAEPAIVLEGVGVRYALQTETAPSLKAWFLRKRPKSDRQERWALRDINLTINQGEVVGFIGSNGAGKSTLLRVIARVLHPTRGRICIRGSVSPMLELGSGLNSQLSGRENIFLKSAMLGFSYANTQERLARIIEFAGLEHAIDAPIRTYSSGMLARLGFAIATDVPKHIMLIDEILAVGDADFQQRSSERIRAYREQGATIVFVAHDLAAVQRICDRVAWIDHGQVLAVGETQQVLRAYQRAVLHGALVPSATPVMDAALEHELRHDARLFVGAALAAPSRSIRNLIEQQFAAPEISPASHPIMLSTMPTSEGYRLLFGMFNRQQATAILGESPIQVGLISSPTLYAHALVQVVALRQQYTQGSEEPLELAIESLLQRPQTQPLFKNPQTQLWGDGSLAQARQQLETSTVLGTLEQPEAAYWLAAFTFGWYPHTIARTEPRMLTTAIHEQVLALAPDDLRLYDYVKQLVNSRQEQIDQALRTRYGDAEHLAMATLGRAERFELLQRHYYARFRQRYPPRSQLRLSMSAALSGAGWYYAQQNGVLGYVRWTGPERLAWIDLPLSSDHELTLSIGLMMAASPEVLQSITLWVNGLSQPRSIRAVPYGGMILEARLSCELLRIQPGITRIGLEVAETFIPAQVDPLSQDLRPLGVAVLWMHIDPVHR
jgi:ABC-2 type transport system ATP-binding protein